MAKRTEMIETALLLIEMLRRIPKNRKIETKELHEQLNNAGFERDMRTIQRNLKTLCEYFDIEIDDRNKPYGYRWKEATVFSLPMLTEQQSLLLMLAEQQLSHLLPPDVLSSMKPFFRQAERQLVYDNPNKDENQWLGKVAVVPMTLPQIPAQIKPEIFSKISTALFRNRYLTIEYRNAGGKIHQAREVMPLGLVYQDTRAYLVVQYKNDQELKHLALNRFISAEISTMKFERPKDFDLKKYKNEGHFLYGEGTKICFTFSTTPREAFYLLETPLSKDQVILEQNEDYFRFQATVFDSLLLEWWIAKFGEDIWDIEKQEIM